MTSETHRTDVEIIGKLGQLEYKYGQIERGRTVMENIVTEYPKKLDVWLIYADMEIAAEQFDRVRTIFERILTLSSLSSKKSKAVFKKYLNFEKEHGTPKSIEHVKTLAMEYVAKNQ